MTRGRNGAEDSLGSRIANEELRVDILRWRLLCGERSYERHRDFTIENGTECTQEVNALKVRLILRVAMAASNHFGLQYFTSEAQ